jgi:hypothetical protein
MIQEEGFGKDVEGIGPGLILFASVLFSWRGWRNE